MKFSKKFAGCFLSAILLIICYPKMGCWLLAWVALVPFLCVIDRQSRRGAFTSGLLFGFLFRYRYNAKRRAHFLPHDNTIEKVWTIAPAIV